MTEQDSKSKKGVFATQKPGHSEELSHLRFSQREGLAPLPSQLALGEVNVELRALIWEVIYQEVMRSSRYPDMGGYQHLVDPWKTMLQLLHVRHLHRPADEYSIRTSEVVSQLKTMVYKSEYASLFDALEFLMSIRGVPPSFVKGIAQSFAAARAAYIVLPDKGLIFPAATESEADTLRNALAGLKTAGLQGGETHLLDAGKSLNRGDFPQSIHDSISAVESVARMLSPGTRTLGPALSKLEAGGHIHNALKSGFGSIYGFTSDEEGIRHPLLDKDAADVDQADALFMLGACAAFVSYLISKARAAKLL